MAVRPIRRIAFYSYTCNASTLDVGFLVLDITLGTSYLKVLMRESVATRFLTALVNGMANQKIINNNTVFLLYCLELAS